MTTTTVRLTDELKTRVAEAAARAGTSTHSFILEAIAEKTVAAEQQQSFLADADARYAAIVKTGRTVPWDEMKQYLGAKIVGKKQTRPRAKSGV